MNRLMTAAQEIPLSQESLTLAPSGLIAVPVPAMDVTLPDVPRTPPRLRTDSDDVSKTSTVAVDPLNSLIGGRNAPGDASLALELHSNQLASSSTENAPWASPRGLRGPTLPPCTCPECPTSISPSCPTQNTLNGQDASPDLEAAVWTGDVCDDAATTVPMDVSANVRRWKEEIDMLLVFAGLFSGVVTGFLTESTKSLRPEPNADTLAALEHISTQLRNPENTPYLSPKVGPFAPSRETVQINCLWFVSLILSLGVAFVSILVKWWLQGHSSRIVRMGCAPPRVSERRRRAPHWHRGRRVAWRVQAIMTALPVLLLVALVLFCAGLSILLITLDVTVGAVAMGVIGFVFVFSAATTVFLSQK